MSSTASDTSHCILQEPVYPVRQMKGALFCTHMWSNVVELITHTHTPEETQLT